jgi:hypothetical protein
MKSKQVRYISIKRTLVFSTVVLSSLGYIPGSASAAQAPINMKTASSYGALAFAAITAANPSTVTGAAGSDLGVGSATPPSGTISHVGATNLGGSSITALSDAASALADNRSGTVTGVELGAGKIMTPGAYKNPTMGINGTLTLNGLGDPNAVFIFRTESTLITGSASKVLLINSAQACNVFWQVGSSATLGTDSTIVGHVIASKSVTATSGTNVNGQLIAVTASVTMDDTAIVNGCEAQVVVPRTRVVVPVTPVVVPVTPVVVPVTPAPSPVVSPNATPVAFEDTTSTYKAPATLHVIKEVINSHGRTSTPSSFLLHVTRNGIEVDRSPMTGLSGTGRTYTLAAGTYILFEDPAEKYRGVWSGDITPGGTITLVAGQELTVTRTNYDIGTTIIRPVAVDASGPVKAPAKTQTGGRLPDTATPWGNAILFGGGLIGIALIGFSSRKFLARA